jgi:uncharacterized protein YlzI (FlbEa/FlbD family)
MIEITDFSGNKILINSDQIKKITQNPDTVIQFLDGSFLVVQSNFEEIQKKIIQYKIQIQGNQLCTSQQL